MANIIPPPIPSDRSSKAPQGASLTDYLKEAFLFRWNLLFFLGSLAGAAIAPLADVTIPLVFAGDFNTWTDERRAAMRAVADKLGLHEVALSQDRRSRFFGKQVDHVLVRGLDVVDAYAVAVHSSDHNPVIATLRAHH